MKREWEQAVRRGCIDEMQNLLADGADIDARDGHGQTALMLAAAAGHARVVEWLVEHAAALNPTAKYSLSALMLAVVRGHVEVVRTLVEGGADPGVRGTGPPGFSDKTALDLAITRGDPEMVELLRCAAQYRQA